MLPLSPLSIPPLIPTCPPSLPPPSSPMPPNSRRPTPKKTTLCQQHHCLPNLYSTIDYSCELERGTITTTIQIHSRIVTDIMMIVLLDNLNSSLFIMANLDSLIIGYIKLPLNNEYFEYKESIYMSDVIYFHALKMPCYFPRLWKARISRPPSMCRLIIVL